MKWFFDGSNILAAVCLVLALAAGALGFIVSDLDSTLQITVMAFAAVLAVVGLGIYAFNFLNPDGGEAGPATR